MSEKPHTWRGDFYAGLAIVLPVAISLVIFEWLIGAVSNAASILRGAALYASLIMVAPRRRVSSIRMAAGRARASPSSIDGRSRPRPRAAAMAANAL